MMHTNIKRKVLNFLYNGLLWEMHNVKHVVFMFWIHLLARTKCVSLVRCILILVLQFHCFNALNNIKHFLYYGTLVHSTNLVKNNPPGGRSYEGVTSCETE